MNMTSPCQSEVLSHECDKHHLKTHKSLNERTALEFIASKVSQVLFQVPSVLLICTTHNVRCFRCQL
jgi:hypothetical protein